jgi:hypothetical protein
MKERNRSYGWIGLFRNITELPAVILLTSSFYEKSSRVQYNI